MDQNKRDDINKKDWICMGLFWVLSIIYGKLCTLKDNPVSLRVEGVLPGLFCIFLLIVVYVLWKKKTTLNKAWLLSGIFVVSQYVGVYWCEQLCGFYDIALHNILFHRVMSNPIFLIPYIAFLLYNLIVPKSDIRDCFTRRDGVLLALLLLPLLVRIVNLFLYEDIVNTAKNTGISVIAGVFFPDTMTAANRMAKAEKIMGMLMKANIYLEYIYRIAIYVIIAWGAIALWKGKISYYKYFSLGGTFLAVHYFIITYFSKLLACVRDFSDSSINIFYHVVMSNSYAVVYILFPILCFIVGVIKGTRTKS